jgi:Flp pilus assembly pilin Flp
LTPVNTKAYNFEVIKNINGGNTMFYNLKRFFERIEGEQEKGQTLVEYALLIVLIAVVSIIALLALGPQIAAVFESIKATLGGVIAQ